MMQITVCNEFLVYHSEPNCPVLAGWRKKKVLALATEVACLLSDKPESEWQPCLDY